MAERGSRDELLGRVDASWQEFSRGLSGIAADSLARPTAAGWTGKAMLAHVAAWHDATAFRLHRFAATGRPQPKVEEDDDLFNARVARETADRPTDELLDSLYDSFRRFRSAIASLPSELDADGWIQTVVAANSFDHYEEHLPELDGLRSG